MFLALSQPSASAVVTVSTDRHPLLKVGESEISPVLIGSLLIHSVKIFTSYLMLPSTMIRLNPELTTLKVIGTDEEDNVSKPLKPCF